MSHTWDDGCEDFLDFGELERNICEFINTSTLISNIKSQLDELDMVQSIFYNPGEISFSDKTIVKELNDFINGKTESSSLRNLDFNVNIAVDALTMEILVNLPLEYPILEPDLYIRCSSFDRNQQHLINNDLSQYVASLPREEACIYSAINWVQDNALKYLGKKKEKPVRKVKVDDSTEDFVRLWIYSHHIYSKCKRKALQDLADEYNLTGFCLPGRPGIICFEGLKSDAEDCWNKVKAMNWKKIVCVKTELETVTEKEIGAIHSLRRFENYREVSFEGGKVRNREGHMDFGEFYKYLEDHGCDYAFKVFFGVDGKTSTARPT